MADANTNRVFTCHHCAVEFTGRKRKFCTTDCREAAKRPSKLHTCMNCAKQFEGRKRKHCSEECRAEYSHKRKVERGDKGWTGKTRRPPNPIIDGYRVCLDCERDLPIDQYPLSKHAKSGYRGVCSQCWRVYCRIKRQAENSRSRLAGKLMREAIKREGESNKIFDLCGYSVSELRNHLEKQFTGEMCWGRFNEIHIDHIIPRAKFDLTDKSEWKACWSLSNLQPRWAKDNLSKGSRSSQLL